MKRLGAHIGLDHLLDGDGRHHSCGETLLVHGISQGQRVHHGGQHAHVIRRGAVHADGAASHATEDVSTTNHHRHLHTHAGDFGDLLDHAHDGGTVDAELIIPHQRLTRQLQQNALVGWCGNGHGVLRKAKKMKEGLAVKSGA
ncbi:hypothetical protein SDC9_170034 [bioreactor metagenome]|uniref:Uncharacterized protein n=1 Tax=bioreactor metagenome TaxID=1076179 RepID=A0A645G6Y1_9ZZZZ